MTENLSFSLKKDLQFLANGNKGWNWKLNFISYIFSRVAYKFGVAQWQYIFMSGCYKIIEFPTFYPLLDKWTSQFFAACMKYIISWNCIVR